MQRVDIEGSEYAIWFTLAEKKYYSALAQRQRAAQTKKKEAQFAVLLLGPFGRAHHSQFFLAPNTPICLLQRLSTPSPILKPTVKVAMLATCATTLSCFLADSASAATCTAKQNSAVEEIDVELTDSAEYKKYSAALTSSTWSLKDLCTDTKCLAKIKTAIEKIPDCTDEDDYNFKVSMQEDVDYCKSCTSEQLDDIDTSPPRCSPPQRARRS